MRVLHVAAMPFPTTQGTQAAVGMFVRTQRMQQPENSVELVTYAHGDARVCSDVVPLRLPYSFGDRSLRSGASLTKLTQDFALGAWLWRARKRFDVFVAHHVEAAFACAVAGLRFDFVVHTILHNELNDYDARALSLPMRAVEHLLWRRAENLFAVSPYLVETLQKSGVRASLLAIPIEQEPRSTEKSVRELLRLPPTRKLVVYSGNLDAYQGLAPMLQAVQRLVCEQGVDFALLTDSDANRLRTEFPRLFDAPTFHRGSAQWNIAGSDVALCPRKRLGGVSLKLLNAMHEQVPVVADAAALSGFAFPGVRLVHDGDWLTPIKSILQG